MQIYLIIGAAFLLFGSLVGIIVCLCVDIVPDEEKSSSSNVIEKFEADQLRSLNDDCKFESKNLIQLKKKNEDNRKVSSREILITIDDSDITGNKQQNGLIENTNFLSNDFISKTNHKKLIKSPFELHNTTKQNKNQTRTQNYAEDKLLNSELTDSPNINNFCAVRDISLSETKQSNKLCAVNTTSKFISTGSSFQYNKVTTRLESVSEIEETISTQSNVPSHKNSSPLIYVDTNN